MQINNIKQSSVDVTKFQRERDQYESERSNLMREMQ